MRLKDVSPIRIVLWACTLGATIRVGSEGAGLGLHIFVILVSLLAWPKLQKVKRNSLFFVRALGTILVGHFLLTLSTSPCTDLLIKGAISLIVLLLINGALDRLSRPAAAMPLTMHMRAIVVIVILSLLIDVALGLSPAVVGGIVRAGGIYSEPSHLALAMTPLLVGLMRARELPDRLWGWGAFAAMMLLSASATLPILVALCFVASLIAQSRRSISATLVFRLTLLISVLVGTVLVSPFRDEFLQRILDLSQVEVGSNISSVVYVNGWEMAIENLVSTNGIGLGFNRMGCEPRPQTDSGAILSYFNMEDQNFNDGSFIMSKILSELGFVGALLWAIALFQLIRMVFVKREGYLPQASPDVQALLISGLVVITIGALIRGTNYLSGTFIFGMFCLLYSLHHKAPKT